MFCWRNGPTAARLRALAADAAGELNVLGHDGNTLVGFGVFGGCKIRYRLELGLRFRAQQ
jgi:hypothetical protein